MPYQKSVPIARPWWRSLLLLTGFLFSGLLLTAFMTACASGQPEMPSTQFGVTEAYDASGRPTDGKVLGSLVWGLGGPAPWPAGLAGQDPAQDPERQRREEEALIRTRFGSNVLIGADGRVTKQYHLTGEAGPVFINLIEPPDLMFDDPEDADEWPAPGTLLGGSEDRSILGRMLAERQVEITYIRDFDTLGGVQIRDQPGVKGIGLAVTGLSPGLRFEGSSTALLLVTGLPSALGGFEDALNLFYANMPQVEITVQVVEYNTTDSLNFGVVPVSGGQPILDNMGSKQLVQAFTQEFPLRAPLLGGSTVSDVGTFTLGGIHDSWAINAKIQALEVNNIADILSSPKIVVRNGGLATISTVTNLPYPKAKITSSGQNITSDIQFKPVGVTLNIRPVIAGTETIILQIYADVSAVTAFASTDPVDTPIISSRMAVTTVHVPAGKTTVVGGLVQESTFDSERKVPILGDIPILGYLFRSTSSQTTKTVLDFLITPRIIQGPQGLSLGSGIGF